MRVIKGGKYNKPPKLKKPKALEVKTPIKIERGADRFDNWLQNKAKEVEANKPPDRYFVAEVKIEVPKPTHNAWNPVFIDFLCFEQPNHPSLDQIIETAYKAWRICTKVEVQKIEEKSAKDYWDFIGDESGWKIIDP